MLMKNEIVAVKYPYTGARPHVQKAIILAAGVGSRLRPFTDAQPKCLVPVNGVPILINTLTCLVNAGIKQTVIVVGHLKENIYERIGASFQGMKITYVESERYATTNNIYSLWLAREHLGENVLLLEADVFFEQELIDRLLSDKGENQSAVVRHQPWMSGTVVRLDDDNRIEALVDPGQQGTDFDYSDTLKTVNIYRFSGDFLRNHFLPRLDAAISAGNVRDFYETILQELCCQDKPAVTAVLCDDVRWFEIDNQDDLTAANYLFADQRQRYEFISSLYGDYWHYDFIDHALLYNLYFPPQAMLDEIVGHLRDVMLNYPSGQDKMAGLVGTLIGQLPSQIVVANGASELINIIDRRLGQRLIVPTPSFNEWVNAAPESFVTEFALEPPSFQLDVDKFAQEAVSCGAGIAVVLNPNNPTSLAVPKADLLRLTRQLAEKDILLVVDESFIDFTEAAPDTTMEPEIERYQNLVIVKSLSKCYGIGGLRLGYLLTNNHKFADAVRKELSIWNINGFAEMFLRLVPRYRRQFAQSCQRVRAACDDLYRCLSDIPGLMVYKPDANFILCRLPVYSMSGPELTEKLFVEHNILIKHCAGKTMPQADRYVRIASRTMTENHILVEALRSIFSGR
jgi:histidinol-phosphate/aromatic aminotransferase/cobyric acid decarboxylase-like protein/choline kinase